MRIINHWVVLGELSTVQVALWIQRHFPVSGWQEELRFLQPSRKYIFLIGQNSFFLFFCQYPDSSPPDFLRRQLVVSRFYNSQYTDYSNRLAVCRVCINITMLKLQAMATTLLNSLVVRVVYCIYKSLSMRFWNDSLGEWNFWWTKNVSDCSSLKVIRNKVIFMV